MKTRKILARIMAIIMACAILSACGGGDKSGSSQPPATTQPQTTQPATTQPAPEPPPAPAPAQTQQNDSNAGGTSDGGDSTELYLEAMSNFIEGTESTIEGVIALTVGAEEISSEEDLFEWCSLFIEAKESIGDAADYLAEMAKDAPEEYLESHVQITFALAFIYDSMTGFEDAIDAAVNGDEDAFYSGLAEFMSNMEEADQLWEVAVGGGDVDDGSNGGDGTEQYLEAMSYFIEGTESTIEGIVALTAGAQEIETEDDLVEWCSLFIEAKESIGDAADYLAEMAKDAPEEYLESHVQITFALAYVYDAMTAFEGAIDAAMNGDGDAFYDGLATFMGNMETADQLWEEAVQYAR